MEEPVAAGCPLLGHELTIANQKLQSADAFLRKGKLSKKDSSKLSEKCSEFSKQAKPTRREAGGHGVEHRVEQRHYTFEPTVLLNILIWVEQKHI